MLQVVNTGTVTGDEVVFGFFSPSALSAQPSNRLLTQLFAFERVHLSPGESASVTFTVSVETLLLVDKASGDIVSTPGKYSILFTNGVENNVTAAVVTVTGPQTVCTPFPAL